jgi:hypothetical protein
MSGMSVAAETSTSVEPTNKPMEPSARLLAALDTPMPGQEELVRRYRDHVVDFVEFADSAEGKSTNNPLMNGIKAWTDSEKATVCDTLKLIAGRCPSLILHAAHGGKVTLFRGTVARGPGFLDGVVKLGLPGGGALGNSIVVTDVYFASSRLNRFCTLSHELTHVADNLKLVSYSKGWMELTAQRLKLLHQTVLDNKAAGLPPADNRFAHYYNFPTPYSATNMSESLADSFAWYVAGLYRPNKKIRDFFESSLLSAPTTTNDGVTALMDAEKAIDEHHYSEGASLLESVEEQYPDYYYAFLISASNHCRLKEYARAMAELEKCKTLVSDLGLPKSENFAYDFHKYHSICLQKQGRSEEALAEANALVETFPKSAEAKELQKALVAGKSVNIE